MNELTLRVWLCMFVLCFGGCGVCVVALDMLEVCLFSLLLLSFASLLIVVLFVAAVVLQCLCVMTSVARTVWQVYIHISAAGSREKVTITKWVMFFFLSTQTLLTDNHTISH
jgi:hypothetical protein